MLFMRSSISPEDVRCQAGGGRSGLTGGSWGGGLHNEGFRGFISISYWAHLLLNPP